MDEQPESSEARSSLEPRHEIVRQLDPLERLTEHELARVEHEGLVVGDRQELGEVGLGLARVDVGVTVVAEDTEGAVDVEVDRRRLEIGRIVWLDAQAAGFQSRTDVPVG